MYTCLCHVIDLVFNATFAIDITIVHVCLYMFIIYSSQLSSSRYFLDRFFDKKDIEIVNNVIISYKENHQREQQDINDNITLTQH